MGKFDKRMLAIAIAVGLFISLGLHPQTAFAWGDNSEDGKGRPSYTVEEINDGAIGATPQSDGEDYKNSPNYPGQIIFNTISDGVIGDEKNFVGTRECTVLSDGRADGATKDTKWNGNDIDVEDGKTYVIRLYVHNSSPNGEDAVVEDTRVSFSIPNEYDMENKRIQVNGIIYSSNASPSTYWDYVNFNSDTPFRLEYIYGSALLNNNKTQDEAAAGGYLDNAGWKLSDDIVKAASVDGVLIGSDSLDGRVPGGFQFASYITIMVKAVFSPEFTVAAQARMADNDDKTWLDSVDAKIGDKVEFRIGYENTSSKSQNGVAIKDILPSNLRYVTGSSVIKNSNHPKGAKIVQDSIVTNGIRIGDYGKAANAYTYFTAEVVDEDLDQGLNILTNWAQAGVGDVTIQDSVEIRVQNDGKYHMVLTVYGVLITICLLMIAMTIWKIIKRNNLERARR